MESTASGYNIATHTISEFYNSPVLCDFRSQLLQGLKSNICVKCYQQDQYDKMNGRWKQLLKSAIISDDFSLSMRSSPHYDIFAHSWKNAGASDYQPVDLQIDLGNVCNSACVMCYPEASSKLSTDYVQLNQLEPDLFAPPKKYTSWTRDPELVVKLVEEIKNLSHLKYIHFLGGETLYDKTFYVICDALISAGIAKNIIVGTTTNCTIYNPSIERYAREFREFHLGCSIETVNQLNDYIRYPSKISDVLPILQRFLSLRSDSNLYVNLSITPNIFTIYHLDQLAEFMINNDVSAESCNILTYPGVLRMELLPEDIRTETSDKLKTVIEKYQLSRTNLPNIRNAQKIRESIGNIVCEYKDFIDSYQVPEDVQLYRNRLVKFLQAFEKIRNNRITDYEPRYQEFLRHHGY
jgi:MoaA/NifB/PqqE/SkfB family radical SAM enzyme